MTCPTPDLTQPTCRICLQNNENEMYSIFDLDSENNNLHIYEKIEECSGIKIILHERIPSIICKNCYAFLKIAYKFRSICRNSNEYFQEFVDCLTPKKAPKVAEYGDVKRDRNADEIVHNIKINETPTERVSSMPPVLIPKPIQEDSQSSMTPSEEQNDDFYDEMWLEAEPSEDNNEKSNKPQVISVEKIPARSEENITQIVGPSNNDSKEPATIPSKTLGISSDGAAVIRDKKPVLKAKKEKQPHICDICGNVYNLRYSLESHMRRHRKEKPFECEICGQAFHCNFELTRHIRKHTGSRPYSCSYCDRSFGDRSTLTKHERIHRNERPYKCETCGKSFTYSSVLKSHQLTHTGEKPYSCELCGKSFSRSHHLRAHLETLQHQNDPLSKILLKRIKRVEDSALEIKVLL